MILGIGDDLLDIRWRHKILIPAFAAIPMLIVYFVDFGVTQVVVPVSLQRYLGELVDLGKLRENFDAITRADWSRLAVLRLHGCYSHILPEQYQHIGRHQRH